MFFRITLASGQVRHFQGSQKSLDEWVAHLTATAGEAAPRVEPIDMPTFFAEINAARTASAEAAIAAAKEPDMPDTPRSDEVQALRQEQAQLLVQMRAFQRARDDGARNYDSAMIRLVVVEAALQGIELGMAAEVEQQARRQAAEAEAAERAKARSETTAPAPPPRQRT